MKKNEQQSRMAKSCPSCGKAKSSGEHAQIVCWDCWHSHPDDPLKYSILSVDEWLKKYSK